MRATIPYFLVASLLLASCSDSGSEGAKTPSEDASSDTSASDGAAQDASQNVDTDQTRDVVPATVSLDSSLQPDAASQDTAHPDSIAPADAASDLIIAGKDAGQGSSDAAGIDSSQLAPDSSVPTGDAAMGDGKVYFYMNPGDLFTNVGNEGIYLLAQLPDLPSSLLQQYATQLSVVTWPEGISVPSTTSIRDENSYGRISIQITAPTTARWYALKVALANGLGVRIRPIGNYVAPGASDDMAVARFMTKPGVRLNYISESEYMPTAEHPEHAWGLVLMLSEAVDFVDLSGQVHLSAAAGSSCAIVPPATDVTTTASLVYRCSSSVIRGLDLTGSNLANGPAFHIPSTATLIPSELLTDNTLTYKFEAGVP